MRIGIIGYGKMGREIERLALERNHEIHLIVDLQNREDLNPENLKKVDVAIEFTTPETACRNIRACFDADVPVVSGTTGWFDKLDEIRQYCRTKNQAFFYASNYSLGVNILFRLNRYLAGIMNHFPEYDVGIEEIHHIHKRDAPSGTAITLADAMISLLDRKTGWTPDGTGIPDSIRIRSVRENEVPGTHTISYTSGFDTLEIIHTARNRQGFALGALLAAEFLAGKKGVFGMEDLLSF